MIDTIKGYIEITNKEYSDFEHLLIDASQNKRSDKDYFTRTFNLSNFKITIQFDLNNKPILLRFNGSLPKFYFGNNLAYLDLESTKKAIEMLSDNLNLDMMEAKITRVDIGFNFILKKPIHTYISHLQRYPRLSSLRYRDSVTFGSENSTISLAFYDKRVEMKKKIKEEIKKNHKVAFQKLKKLNNTFPDKHIFRYETRIRRLLNKKLGSESLKAKNLYSESIQKELFSIWHKHYHKTKKLYLNVDPTYLLQENKRNGFLSYLAFHGMNKLGYDKIISVINSLEFNVKDQKQKRSKITKPFDKILKEINSKKLEGNIIKELDSKIELMGEIFN